MEKALNVLEKLTNTKKTKTERLTDLLKNPEEDFSQHWYFCVSKSFNDALDIKRTVRVQLKQERLVWTQGSAFSFKAGDVLYDTPLAYSLPWFQALHEIHLVVQISKVSDEVTFDSAEVKHSTSVEFEVLVPDETKTRLDKIGADTLSQQEFVRFLIMGPEKNLQSIISRKIDKSG